MGRYFFAALCVTLAFASPAPAEDDAEKLINQLTKVAEPGVGYSVFFSGAQFLPYDDAEELGTFVLGGTARSRSDVLRQIVAQGAAAVPVLLKHLSDERKIDMPPLKGMMWMSFDDEYDFNRTTRKKPPNGVNRDMLGSDAKHPDEHALTIGDLCFVAIGQIVNRNFAAARYQPTGGLIISSPTYSEWLRDVVVKDWSDFTSDAHRRLLLDDFEHPDQEQRRIGAYLRLAFYYPDAVEPLVLAELARPTYDGFVVEAFCRDTLYKTAAADERKRLYDEFIGKHGPHYAPAVMDYLFQDLDTLEAHEERRISPPLTRFSTQPRELLIQLFDKPAGVKSTDCPRLEIPSDSERARLIGAMTHDQSQKIGEAVKQILLDNLDDDYLSSACLKCLANRGYGKLQVEILERINFAEMKTDPMHLQYLESIRTSHDPAVQDRLLQIIQTTTNAQYFTSALSGLKQMDDAVVLASATRILAALPADTDQGHGVLTMIAERFPERARDVFKAFLAPGTTERAETVCEVLWNGHPLSKEILAPLLDDKRELKGFSTSMRVCDRAAQAVSHTQRAIRFNSDWSEKLRDETIGKLKAYCAESTK